MKQLNSQRYVFLCFKFVPSFVAFSSIDGQVVGFPYDLVFLQKGRSQWGWQGVFFPIRVSCDHLHIRLTVSVCQTP